MVAALTFALILAVGDLRAVLHDVVQVVLEAAHILQRARRAHRSVRVLIDAGDGTNPPTQNKDKEEEHSPLETASSSTSTSRTLWLWYPNRTGNHHMGT